MGAADRKCARVRIRGRVQGVWFRAWTREEALRRGLAGWVRNRADGSVEAIFAGDPAMVDDMVAACWRGPSAARVATVEVEHAEAPTEDGFEQRPTI